MELNGQRLATPPTYAMPFPMVREYMTALWKWQKDGAPFLPDYVFRSVDVSNFTQALPDNFTEYRHSLPSILGGVWCGDGHPSQLACFVVYPSDKEEMPDAVGLPAQGYRPGHVFFWDTPGARNTLEFFTQYDLEFTFPKFRMDNTNNVSASSIWNYMRRPFRTVPYPAAVLEGFPDSPLQLIKMRSISGNTFWDPANSADPAICFCSAHFDGEDLIVRNNFGNQAYTVTRVIDENGKKTSNYPKLAEWAAGRRLVRVNFPLQPDPSCPGMCPIDVAVQCLIFYLPIVLLVTCCCLLPGMCIAWHCAKCHSKRKLADDESEYEEGEGEADNLM